MRTDTTNSTSITRRRIARPAAVVAATGLFAFAGSAAPALAFNPQPDPPGATADFNPQPDPPGAGGGDAS